MTQRGLTLVAPANVACDDILTPPALALLTRLARAYGPRIYELMRARRARQARFDDGSEKLAFTSLAPRDQEWKVRAIPGDLMDRRVEITGPVDPKMIINALNSGADTFMADFEDSLAPSWKNLIEGQRALQAAVRGTLTHVDEKSGKRYALHEQVAVLMARPRGLHLPERHLLVDGTAMPGSLFDAGLYLFHNARALVDKGSGPYLYLPKLEGAKEAQVWADALDLVEDALVLPRGTIRCTVLIETLPAAFEMDDILWVLRDHIVGLNCGRWDYIFSTIKRRRREPGFVLPDRASVTMEQRFLRSYTQLLVKTCHRRGAFAMGGMSAFIPRKDDPEQNALALEKVRADKRREAGDGHDGTWVAHPGLVAIAREAFARPNQLDVMRDDVDVSAADLLAVPDGARTEKGLRHNARVGVQYLAAWLDGLGCVPIEHLMEDAATAEISRAQIWQWLHAHVDVDGAVLTEARAKSVIDEETRGLTGANASKARDLFLSLCLKNELEEFLTLPAYELLLDGERRS